MMFSNFRSIKARHVSFGDAIRFQKMMRPVVKALMAARFKHVKRAEDVPEMEELWLGLCGVQSYEKLTTIMAQCVDSTIPPEYVPVVRRSAGVTTAFAWCEIAKQLIQVKDFQDDLEVRQAMVRGWVEFEKRRQQANQIQEGFGCDDSQSWHTLRDIAEEKDNDPNLLQQMLAIAALAGRMFEHFGYQRKDEKNNNPEETVGAKPGGDLERLLPTELALLGDEDTADLQSMKILQDQSTILQMEGIESKCRGPMVLCVDESGSMSDGNGYYSGGQSYAGRNTWAKAACVALTRIAWSEDRAVVCVHFGSGSEVQEVPKDDYRAMFEMARSFMSGGTSFDVALTQGIEQVGELELNGKAGADILLITDGEEHDYPTHNARIDEMDLKGIKLWTVSIGQDMSRNAPVRTRAERYTFASDSALNDPRTAVNLAQGLDGAARGNDPTTMN